MQPVEQIQRKRPGRPARAEARPERRSARSGAEDFGEFQEFDNYSTLPMIADTEDWHYCWVRCSLNGAIDGKNLSKYQRGPVRYEVVSADELPDLQTFRATHAAGANGDVIQIDDVILMRCPQAQHQKQLRYYDRVTAGRRAALKQQTEDRFREVGGDNFGVKLDYKDQESGGLQTIAPEGDE